MLSRRATIGAITALTLLSGGCRYAAAQPTQVPPEVRFAREFIRVLQDSGSAAVLPLATPKTRALKGFAPNMDVLRSVLASTHATLTLDQWNAVPKKDDVPSLIHVVFKVQGVGAPSELSLWIEEASGHYLLNTISIAGPHPQFGNQDYRGRTSAQSFSGRK